MTREEFIQLIGHKCIMLDGATGSNLQKRGMPAGVCPEQWILEHKEVMQNLQKEYIQAGTDILYAPTFSGNRIKLAEYGLESRLDEMNAALVQLTKEAVIQAEASHPVYIAGDLTMTGKQLYPVGDLHFEELVDIYKEQIASLVRAGVDLLVVETMMSLQECRAAVLAAKETCDLPVMVTLTFNEDMRTLYGTDPATAVVVMESMGVDAVGLNCSVGPDKMMEVVKIMTEYATIPLIAKPNAGLPHLVEQETVYDMEPQEFAEAMSELVKAGIDIVGGCCGTTPEHMVRLHDVITAENWEPSYKKRIEEGNISHRVLTTERRTVPIDLDGAFMIVGERINPTGKKALQEELKAGRLDMVCEMAEQQAEAGAAILDVNMGMNGIDEKEMMLKVIYELTMLTNIPLSIDSSYVDVVEAALRIYPGRALINSISLEPEKFQKLIPLAKKYGAMFILLPLSDKGLPKDMDEKISIIHTILEEAKRFGMTEEDIIVDGLVATIGANKRAAIETLETIRYCKEELGVATICGLSNISFGLPERMFVNSNFMALAIREGLTMAIANPAQDLLMHAVYAADLLMDKPEADIRYINRVTGHKVSVVSGEVSAEAVAGIKKQPDTVSGAASDYTSLMECVVKGNQKKIIPLLDEALKEGKGPSDLIDEELIPGIVEVGRLFDKQIYFLPQLIASAETMKMGIDYLEPLLAKERSDEVLATIIIATVEHDIHDIGKNLVALMLKNYGYRVIDLGKDVPAETIVSTAKEEKAAIIGLSALMTTTMMEMKKVVELVREEGLDTKVIIGGAVITQSFADEIGADGYSKDAQEAVTLVQRLLAK